MDACRTTARHHSRRLAWALVLASTAMAPVDAAHASVLGAVNRALETVCAPRTQRQLIETRGADAVATRLLYGDTLHHAIGLLPVRPAFAGSIHLVAVNDDHAVAAAVSSRFCADLRESGVTELGVAGLGPDLWLVVVAPLAVPRVEDAPVVARDVLARVNEARASGRRCGVRAYAPVAPLGLSPLLTEAAAAHSGEMARAGILAHEGAGGTLPADRARRTGYAPRLVGENIASGVPDASGVVDGWLESPPHCANLMDGRFTEMGIAYAVNAASSGGIYWTQLLATPR
jgi:uncharacterized protein YkwD